MDREIATSQEKLWAFQNRGGMITGGVGFQFGATISTSRTVTRRHNDKNEEGVLIQRVPAMAAVITLQPDSTLQLMPLLVWG